MAHDMVYLGLCPVDIENSVHSVLLGVVLSVMSDPVRGGGLSFFCNLEILCLIGLSFVETMPKLLQPCQCISFFKIDHCFCFTNFILCNPVH